MTELLLTLAAFGYFLCCLHVIRKMPKEGWSKKLKYFAVTIIVMCVVAVFITIATLYLVD